MHSEHDDESTDSIFQRLKDSTQGAYTVSKRVAKEPFWGFMIFAGAVGLFIIGAHRLVTWFASQVFRIR
jgi:hypothetical protein